MILSEPFLYLSTLVLLIVGPSILVWLNNLGTINTNDIPSKDLRNHK